MRQLLASGYEVSAVLHRDRSPNPFDHDVRVFRADVTQPETLVGPLDDCELVIHLAGCTLARTKRDFDVVNRLGTLNVARHCAARQTPPRLLFVSSLAAAGPAQAGRPLRESDRPQPVSAYGRSKLAAEQELLRVADRLPVQIVRPCSVFGDTDRYMLGLFKAAKAGWVVLPGRETASYSLIQVDDLARALMHVATRGETAAHDPSAHSGVVFLAHGPPMTFPQIASVVSGTLGTGTARTIHVPAVFCWGVAAANSAASRMLGVRPLLNLDKMREGMAGAWMCDTSRLTDDLGFEFQVSLRERIQQTAESYRDKRWI